MPSQSNLRCNADVRRLGCVLGVEGFCRQDKSGVQFFRRKLPAGRKYILSLFDNMDLRFQRGSILRVAPVNRWRILRYVRFSAEADTMGECRKVHLYNILAGFGRLPVEKWDIKRWEPSRGFT
ncbi:hypothetical protein WG66_013061 [Moniliophthora roreri]|nr:hypothetical protein WG66_013061 [Moniliophthora roreri]